MRYSPLAFTGLFFAIFIQLPLAASAIDRCGTVGVMGTRNASGSCAGSITPDTVLIAGGISEEGNEPVAVRKALNSKIDKVKEFVKKAGGTLELNGIGRSIKETQVPGYAGSTSSLRVIRITQQIEANFEPTVEVEPILQGILEAGLTEFGRAVAGSNNYNNYNQPKQVVLWTVKEPLAAFDDMIEKCKAKIVQEFCKANSGQPGGADCGPDLAKKAVISNYSLNSTPIVNEQGYPQPISVYYPGNTAMISNLFFTTEASVKFSGSMNITIN